VTECGLLESSAQLCEQRLVNASRLHSACAADLSNCTARAEAAHAQLAAAAASAASAGNATGIAMAAAGSGSGSGVGLGAADAACAAELAACKAQLSEARNASALGEEEASVRLRCAVCLLSH
jgi:hypothetical protein